MAEDSTNPTYAGAYIPKDAAQQMIDTFQADKPDEAIVCYYVDAGLLQKLLNTGAPEIQIILADNGNGDNATTLVMVGTNGSTQHVYYDNQVLEHVMPAPKSGIPGKADTTLE